MRGGLARIAGGISGGYVAPAEEEPEPEPEPELCLFEDDFNRGDGGLGANYVAGIGALAIASNGVRAGSAETLEVALVNPAVLNFEDDHSASIDMGTLGNFDSGGVVVRGDGTRGYGITVGYLVGGLTRRIYRFSDATTRTVIGTVDISPASGQRVTLEAEGTTIRAYIDGVLIDSATDATYSDGQPGLNYYRGGFGGMLLDNFSAEGYGDCEGGGEPPASEDWYSNFSAATGYSEEALTDGFKWQIRDGSSPQVEIVTVDLGDPDWPANMRRMEYDGGYSHTVEATELWEAPAEGQSAYFRFLLWYGLVGENNLGGDHGQQSNIGSIQHTFGLHGIDAGPDHFKMGFGAAGRHPSLVGGVFVNNLPRFTRLRVELALHRLTGLDANVEIAIYNEEVSKEVPGWTGADFFDNWGAGTRTMADYPLVTMSDLVNGFQNYLLGVSGSGAASGATPIYVGGFRHSLVAPCGPYDPLVEI